MRTRRYKAPAAVETSSALGRHYSEHAERGLTAARGARALRDRHGFVPDVIIGHPGWGETLFAKDIPAFENLASLERLPARGAHVIALPMKIAGGSGAPLRAVAILPAAAQP